MAAPAPLHADRGHDRNYTAGARRSAGQTSTTRGLTNGHLKLHPELHQLDGRDQQAYLILAEGELGMRRAMAEANGVPMANQPLLPGGLYLVRPESAGRPRESIIVQTYVPRSKPSIK